MELGQFHSISINIKQDFSETIKSNSGSMAMFIVMKCAFMAFFYCIFCYFQYYSIKQENQLKLVNENFKAMIDCLDSAIISQTSENKLSFCNVSGLKILKRIATSQLQSAEFID